METNNLKKALERAIELIDELRCYNHNWDWRYGEYWDSEIKEIRNELNKNNLPNSIDAVFCGIKPRDEQ